MFYHKPLSASGPVQLRRMMLFFAVPCCKRRTTRFRSLLFCNNSDDSGTSFDVKPARTKKAARQMRSAAVLIALLFAAAPAHAFRCGNKIVIEDMHEQQVINACGEPTAMRHLGYTVRAIGLPHRRNLVLKDAAGRFAGMHYYTEEVIVTEYIYNFGPRKFMRRLVFEGGFLVEIESLGYGYREREE